MKTIVKMLFGAHLYGTATSASDIDLKSVHIPDASDILLQRVQDEITGPETRNKAIGEKNKSSDVDDKSYSLQKFLKLAAEGQTVALDMLFAPKEMIETTSGWWHYIVANRHRLLSRKGGVFVGYCRDQANKYGIKGSRVAAAQLSSEFFSNQLSQLGPSAKVGDLLTGMTWLVEENPEHMGFYNPINLDSSKPVVHYFECCNRKVPFTASVKLASEIYTRVYNEYGDRAKKVQTNEGVDWKALSHAVSVGTEAVEFLSTGNITLPLRNAHRLLEIKLGLLPFQQVSEEIDKLLVDVEEAAKTSSLPDEPDYTFIEDTIKKAYGTEILMSPSVRMYLPWNS